jgi:putative phosphoesterase
MAPGTKDDGMLIGCISDTHVHDGALPPAALDAFAGVDLILHAGDILDLGVLEELSRVAETLAVRGNMDAGETAASLPDRRIIEAAGFKIGLTHGRGAPIGIVSRVASVFEGEECDCVVFGHTHKAFNERRRGVLFFNPGSPTDNIFSRRNTVGLLEVTGAIEGRIIDLKAGGS